MCQTKKPSDSSSRPREQHSRGSLRQRSSAHTRSRVRFTARRWPRSPSRASCFDASIPLQVVGSCPERVTRRALAASRARGRVSDGGDVCEVSPGRNDPTNAASDHSETLTSPVVRARRVGLDARPPDSWIRVVVDSVLLDDAPFEPPEGDAASARGRELPLRGRRAPRDRPRFNGGSAHRDGRTGPAFTPGRQRVRPFARGRRRDRDRNERRDA